LKKPLRIALIIVGVVVLLIVFVILNRSHKDSGVECETRVVGYGSILSKVSATGSLRARAQVNLQAQMMGVVKRVRVKDGDWVRRGDTLLELDRQAYEAQLVLARAQFNQTRLKHARMESLWARGFIAPEQFEASKTAYDVAEAQFLQMQDQYDKTVICAPISGLITQVNIKEGETAIIGTMNYAGTVLLVIADLSQMEALAEVDETDVVMLEPGQAASITIDALPDAVFTGRVIRVGYMPVQKLLTTEQTATNFEVEIAIDNTSPSLRPGMTVHAEIITARLDSVLVVPIQAVGRRMFKGKETETVFIVKKGKALLTPIRTGKSSDTEIEVLEGLLPKDEVIIGPYKLLSRLTDGTYVNPRQSQTETSD